MSVTIYTTPNCQQCRLTRRALDEAGVEYQVIDLTTDEAARAYVVDQLGHRQAPVVVTERDHWSGFDPNRLSTITAPAASDTPTDHQSGVIGHQLGHDETDQCRACGAHISDPHATGCPAETVAALRQDAEEAEEAHRATVRATGYTSGPSPTAILGDAPTEVSHRFLATAQRLAADLIEADHVQGVNLDGWPAAAEFVAYLTGEADPWTA